MNYFSKARSLSSASASPAAASVIVELLPAYYGLVLIWRRSRSGPAASSLED